MTEVKPVFGPQTKEILLTQGKVALVDASDFEWLSQWNWYAARFRGQFYAQRHRLVSETGPAVVQMQRALLPGTSLVDHRDGDGLNNRRSNLRPASRSQNKQNQSKHRRASSQYKGVCWHKGHKAWAASIRTGGRLIHLGYFLVEVDAAKAYDAGAKEYFVEFARVNFP
jgi:HNH endonuclease